MLDAKAGADEPINLAARRPLHGSGIANSFMASTGAPLKPSQVVFDRRDLQAILRVYGFGVADGEWRDYTIDFARDRAMFCVYRKSSEAPLFRIVKDPALARRQGAYCVIGQRGDVLKRGHEISQVLGVLERRLKAVG